MPILGGFLLVEKETTEFDDWSLKLGPYLTGAKTQKVQSLCGLYHRCFVYSLHDLESYKKKPIHIQLEDDHFIFQRPYRLSVYERIGVQAHCQELLVARLINLSNGEYVCATVMSSKKNMFGNWTEKRICRDF